MGNKIEYKMSIYEIMPNGKHTVIIYRVCKEKTQLDKIIHQYDYNPYMVEYIRNEGGFRNIIKHYEYEWRKEKITKLLNDNK